jgi:inosine/xanthosine triphosphate pyrophosphatase family protein
MIETQGTCEGRIAYVGRGAHGYGYDPLLEFTEATGAPLSTLE